MPGKQKPINYGQFGQNFIEKVVTAERINAALGPAMKIPALKLKAGPAGIAEVQVTGTSSITDVKTLPEKLPEVWFKATAVMGFQLTMGLLGTEQKYHGNIQLALAMHVQTFDPLTIFLEVQKVTEKDVEVTREAENVPAEIVEGRIQPAQHHGRRRRPNDHLELRRCRASDRRAGHGPAGRRRGPWRRGRRGRRDA